MFSILTWSNLESSEACVSYSNSAKEIFPLTYMTENSRSEILAPKAWTAAALVAPNKKKETFSVKVGRLACRWHLGLQRNFRYFFCLSIVWKPVISNEFTVRFQQNLSYQNLSIIYQYHSTTVRFQRSLWKRPQLTQEWPTSGTVYKPVRDSPGHPKVIPGWWVTTTIRQNHCKICNINVICCTHLLPVDRHRMTQEIGKSVGPFFKVCNFWRTVKMADMAVCSMSSAQKKRTAPWWRVTRQDYALYGWHAQHQSS